MDRSIEMDGGEVLFCKIRNVIVDDVLCDETISMEQRMNLIRPVHSVRQTYFNWDGTSPGDWKSLMQDI